MLVLAVATRLDAQVVERPMAFDSAGKIGSLTPSLVTRLGLSPPAWPVHGDFLQARVFSVSTGGSVLVAERAAGVLERHMLTDEQLQALRSRVDAAMTVIGSRVGEDRPDMISAPARGAFLRNQMILAAGLYGPLLASLSNDGQTATALYLISVGGSYFALNNISSTTPITRAQNDLATDGAIRGAGTAAGLMRAFGGGDVHQKTYSGIALGGAVMGSAVGYVRGRGLTDGEAHAAMTASTFAAGTVLGIVGAFGPERESAERTVAGSMVAAGLAGYLLGPNYPRRARYTVTAGDVRLLTIGAVLGVMAGVTPFVNANDTRGLFASGTIGGITGIGLAERGWARPYDNSTGDVTQTWLGTIAGGLLGGAVTVLVAPEEAAVAMGLITGGAVGGAIAGHSFAKPAPAKRLGAWRFTPENLAFAAARVPGRHALLALSFWST